MKVMKLVLTGLLSVLLNTIVATSAFAGNGIERADIDFTDSLLTVRAQDKIAMLLTEAYGSKVSIITQIKAATRDVNEIRIDQGVIDYVYTIELKVRGEQGTNDDLKLVLRENAISNPAFDPFEVIEFN